jgi:cation transport regulator
MPYSSNDELPLGVRNKLPAKAQTIYREAYNHAYEFYKDPHKRREDRDLEGTAHSVAWSAVEKKYKKTDDGEWVEI